MLITIRDEWRSYFEHIYTPNSNNQDKKFDEHVKQVVADFSANINTDREMHVCNNVIMSGEVEIVCKQLKLNVVLSFLYPKVKKIIVIRITTEV